MLLDLLDMLASFAVSGILLAEVAVSIKLSSTVTIDVRDFAGPLWSGAQMVHMPRKRIELHDLDEGIRVRYRPAGRARDEARRGPWCRCGGQARPMWAGMRLRLSWLASTRQWQAATGEPPVRGRLVITGSISIDAAEKALD